MKNKFRSLLASAAILAGLAFPVTAMAPNAVADDACPGAESFGIGGWGDGTASVFQGRVDVPVYYSGWLDDIEGGVAALARDVDAFRAYCPESQLILAGHSQGAAIVHVYVSRNPWLADVPATAVLYSDPKQLGTGQSDLLFQVGGYPIAGTDATFNGVPVTSVCSVRDAVCNWRGGWNGYLFEGAHVAPYEPFDPYAYAWWDSTVWLP
jgi:cutinase